ncbi:hypothetical protein AMECASPLE_020143 [Ameca splendens]|uniref:Uncharacterized protein n=1 Tax=Ameca splendens TaxID=208324 RepID=A0ABV0XSC0_9TELE
MFCQCHPSNTTNLSISDSESYSPSPDLHLHYQIVSRSFKLSLNSTFNITSPQANTYLLLSVFVQIPVQNPKVLYLVFLNTSFKKPSSVSVIVDGTRAEANMAMTQICF